MSRRFDGLEVADKLDSDGDLLFDLDSGDTRTYVSRDGLRALRDHLTAVLGDAFPPPLIRAGDVTLIPEPAMSRADALKLAEETVTRLAPATNGRGYSDGTASLTDRMSAILRTAAYLMKESE